jgi:hypothetical protein
VRLQAGRRAPGAGAVLRAVSSQYRLASRY